MKANFWVWDREFVGFVYKGICWICEKCLDLRIDIKNLVGCQSDFFFFLFGETKNFVWLPRKWIIKFYFLLIVNDFDMFGYKESTRKTKKKRKKIRINLLRI